MTLVRKYKVFFACFLNCVPGKRLSLNILVVALPSRKHWDALPAVRVFLLHCLIVASSKPVPPCAVAAEGKRSSRFPAATVPPPLMQICSDQRSICNPCSNTSHSECAMRFPLCVHKSRLCLKNMRKSTSICLFLFFSLSLFLFLENENACGSVIGPLCGGWGGGRVVLVWCSGRRSRRHVHSLDFYGRRREKTIVDRT